MFWPLFFKYETLRYRFEDDGMSMSWGVLFRHEIHLTYRPYRRIQDIHLSRNLIQRWLGLATLSIRLFKDSFLGEPHKAGRTRPTQLQKSLICQCVSRVETVMHSNVVNYLFSMEAS